MLALATIRKAMMPQPVYVAHCLDGTTIRMSFFSRSDKPLDIARGRSICNQVAYGKQIIAGHVEHKGEIVAYDGLVDETKRKRGPSSKACVLVIRALLEHPDCETTRAKAKALVA